MLNNEWVGQYNDDYLHNICNTCPGNFNDRMKHLLRNKFDEDWVSLEKQSDEIWGRWFYRVVKNILFTETNEFDWLNPKQITDKLRVVNISYTFLKEKFIEKTRSNWERYFDHLVRVALIVLLELPNPSLKKVLKALWHDSIEDTNITITNIEQIIWWKLWKDVAKTVQNLSKSDLIDILRKEKNIPISFKLLVGENYIFQISLWNFLNFMNDNEKILNKLRRRKQNDKTNLEKDLRDYLTEQDIMKLSMKAINMMSEEDLETLLRTNDKRWILDFLKDIRNRIYFDHFKQMTNPNSPEYDPDWVDVKFADRIHNSRTEKYNTMPKILRKMVETINEIIPVAKEINIIAYELLMKEIAKLLLRVKYYELLEIIWIEYLESLKIIINRIKENDKNWEKNTKSSDREAYRRILIDINLLLKTTNNIPILNFFDIINKHWCKGIQANQSIFDLRLQNSEQELDIKIPDQILIFITKIWIIDQYLFNRIKNKIQARLDIEKSVDMETRDAFGIDTISFIDDIKDAIINI